MVVTMIGTGQCLELKAGFTGGIGEGLDLAVIEVTATVEDHGTDFGALGALGEELADFLGALDVGGSLLELLVHGGRGYEGLAFDVVDDLGSDVLVREVNREAWTLGSTTDLAPDAFVDPLADRLAFDNAHVGEMVGGYLPTLLPSLRRTYSSE